MLWWILVLAVQLERRLEPCMNRIKAHCLVTQPIDWPGPYSLYLLVPLAKPLEPGSADETEGRRRRG